MKKLILITLLTIFVILFVSNLQAFRLWNGQPTASITTSSTTNAVVVTGPGVLYKIFIQTDGKSNVAVTAYDASTTTVGTLLTPTSVTFSSNPMTDTLDFGLTPIFFSNGVYVTISGQTCSYSVQYGQ